MSSNDHQGSVSHAALLGRAVLVTRPREQAESLCRLIEGAGGKAIRFPVIEISPLHDAHTNMVAAKQLCRSDMVIFISANAVRFGVDMLLKSGVSIAQMQVVAIGRATATALMQSGVQVNITPDSGYTSEALLATAQMQDVADKTITIFKGEGGRELLANTLTERGARVSNLVVYRRDLPNISHDEILSAWSSGGVDVVVVTSQEGLANLFKLIGDKGKYYIQHTPMIVISERLKQACVQLQMQAPVVVAAEASDEAILAALTTLFSKTISGVDDE